ncbi:MAG: discoidin domain-containing protein [Lachnospiraceae bacterium]|jgi:hypothetical protein|nr:discoidin domain-containing protein [Lachnospiraceae bacterium]
MRKSKKRVAALVLAMVLAFAGILNIAPKLMVAEAATEWETVFTEDFSGDLSKWEKTGNSTMSISNGTAVTSVSGYVHYAVKDFTASGSTIYEFDMKNTSGDAKWGGVQYNQSSVGNGNWDNSGGQMFYIKGNGAAELYRAGTGLAASATVSGIANGVHVKIEYTYDTGNTKIYIDNATTPIINYTDPDGNTTHNAGRFGLVSANQSVTFDNFTIKIPKETPSTNVNLVTPTATVIDYSSYIAGNATWKPDNVKDGSYTTGFSTDGPRNTADYNEFISIKIDSPSDMNKIVLVPRWSTSKSIPLSFPVDFTIQVSKDGSNWTTAVTETGYAVTANEPQVFYFAKQSDIQYIKINATKLGSEVDYNADPNSAFRMQIMEIEAYYDPSNLAKTIADGIKSISVDDNLDTLILPKYEGFTVSIESSSDTSVIATDGTVNRTTGGTSNIVLRITNNDDSSDTALTAALTVNVESFSQLLVQGIKIISGTATSEHPSWKVDHLYNGIVAASPQGDFWSTGDEFQSGTDPYKDVNVTATLTLEKPSNLSKIELYPRRETTPIYFPRSFNIEVSGDGQTWKTIKTETDYTVSDPTKPWVYELTPEAGVKYVRINITKMVGGSQNVNGVISYSYYSQIAEAVLYETPEVLTAQQVADTITSLTLGSSDTKITIPSVSALYKIEIESSGDTSIIALDGAVTRPTTGKTVNIKIKVTNKQNPSDIGYTNELPVFVESPDDAVANAAAKAINFIELPSDYTSATTTLSMPTLSGYTVTIAEVTKDSDGSDATSIVDLNGNVTRPVETTGVRIKFKVVNNSTGGVGYTKALLLPVYKPYVAPTMSSQEIADIKAGYEQNKYGVFVHYVMNNTSYPGSYYSDGTKVQSIDDLAAGFDAAQFAKDMHDFGAEYVVFTVWHAHTLALFPSMTNERWRDDRRTGSEAYNLKSYSDRDVIEELLDELDKYGIELHLYTHPTDGHDFSSEDQALTGWNNYSTPGVGWQKYINELYYELCERYGTRIKGLWYDGAYVRVPAGACQAALRETSTKFNPAMIMTGNTGFTAGQANPGSGWNGPDYRAWESGLSNLDNFYITNNQVAMVVAGQWWTDRAQSVASNMTNSETLFRYVAAEASISRQGGMLASTGFYPIKTTAGQTAADLNGDFWMKGVRDMLVGVNAYLEPVADSIKSTKKGAAYVSQENWTVSGLDWGVQTESPDGETVYLHVLQPAKSAVSGLTLTLPAPADGSVFARTAVLMNQDKTGEKGFDVPTGDAAKVEVVKKSDGSYEFTLPAGSAWSTVDTVIAVTRVTAATDKSALSAKIAEAANKQNETDYATTYTEATRDTLAEELIKAQATYDALNATQDEVDDETTALDNAIKALLLDVDKSALQLAYEQVKTASESEDTTEKYTEDSWKEYTDALKEAAADAKAVLDDVAATKTDVSDAIDALVDAVADAKKLLEERIITDKTELDAAILASDDVELGANTTKTWEAYEEAVKNGKEVFADPKATQEEIDDATDEIKSAEEALKINDNSSHFKDNIDTHELDDSANLVHIAAHDWSLHSGKVEVDGKEITKGKDYETQSGSTVTVLLPAFLNTLSEGIHTLKVYFTGNIAPAVNTFEITKVAADNNEPDTGGTGTVTGDNDTENGGSDTGNATTNNSRASSDSADTGDNAETTLYLIICLLAILAIAGITYLRKMGYLQTGQRK